MKRLFFDVAFLKNLWQSIFRQKVEILPKAVGREMHSSSALKTAVRKPLIKFIGARLPRPFFDASSLPPLQVSGNFTSSLVSSSAPKAAASSIGVVGKLPRGSGIEPSQLPLKFRRHGLSEEECDAINTGFFHQR